MNRGLNRSAQAACPIVREFYSSVGHTHFLTRVDYIWYIMDKTILWSTRLSFPYSSPTLSPGPAPRPRPRWGSHNPTPTLRLPDGPHRITLNLPPATGRAITKNSTAHRRVRIPSNASANGTDGATVALVELVEASHPPPPPLPTHIVAPYRNKHRGGAPPRPPPPAFWREGPTAGGGRVGGGG